MSTATHPLVRPVPVNSNSSCTQESPVARNPHDARASDVVKVMRDDGTLDPSTDPRLTEEEVTRIYRTMLRNRALDERMTALQRQGRIGFHVGSAGEEATIIGSAYALRPQDWVFPCYRELGAALIRGFPFQNYIDNMFGNSRDLAKGRQMPDHYFSRKAHVVSISSPIGTQITHAVGFSWAARLRGEDLAALTYFGDGATSSSDFHGGMNFAGVFKTPTIFLCRNNGWAISVPTERQTASNTFAEKGVAYGVPSVRVDGNDVFAVIKVTRDAIGRASRGEGPTLIEALTYRLSGHTTSDDPRAYRPDASLEPWKPLDPLVRLRKFLDRTLGWTDENDQIIEAELESELKTAVASAESAPPPSLQSLFEDVYGSQPWHLREQHELLLQSKAPKER